MRQERDENGRFTGHGLAERVDALARELDQRLTALDVRLSQRFELDDRARDLAYLSLEKRLTLLNELRGDVMSKSEYEVRHDAVVRSIHQLERLVYMGVGIALVAQVILWFVLRALR